MTQYIICFSSVQSAQSCLTLCDPMNARLPCPSPTPGVYSNPCPSSWWCHPTISSSVNPFSHCLQSFPASGSHLYIQLIGHHGYSKYTILKPELFLIINIIYSLNWGLLEVKFKLLDNSTYHIILFGYPYFSSWICLILSTILDKM